MIFNEMEGAPRDGTPILAYWFNGCGWECAVVWWGGGVTYPWCAGFNDYPEDKFDYWMSIQYPTGWM